MKPSDMTDEQLRIKVAELLGWENVCWSECTDRCGCWLQLRLVGTPPHADARVDSPCAAENELPDYARDLNACHEMYLWGEENYVGSLASSPKSDRALAFGIKFAVALSRIVHHGAELDDPIADSKTINADARQRCEAFVEVMESDRGR